MTDILKKQYWEDSYKRQENYMFYPKEEVVKFLNRFIRKKTGLDSYGKFLIGDKEVRGLDFGCGIGRITALMCSFGVDAYGIDISELPYLKQKNCLHQKIYPPPPKVSTYNGQHIPFDDCFFDFTISEAVMDSLPFSLAKQLVKEIDRVTKKYFYLSLISPTSTTLFSSTPSYQIDLEKEITVQEKHEFGTIQSFYDLKKIEALIQETNFKIIWGELIEHQNILHKDTYGRYHIVLEKCIKK